MPARGPGPARRWRVAAVAAALVPLAAAPPLVRLPPAVASLSLVGHSVVGRSVGRSLAGLSVASQSRADLSPVGPAPLIGGPQGSAPGPAGAPLRPPGPAPGPPRARVPVLRPPVPGPVVRGFEAPAGPYGAGHRGVDLGAPSGSPVGAPAPGRVLFAGPVAGSGWVSLEVSPGVVVTLGPLAPVAVARGGVVGALALVGRSVAGAGHDGAVHLGLRVDGVYVDPLPYLSGRGPPRLAPLPAPGGR
jgi:murein DD-endopeptidase MepM/ murein hydrolase activator NlpD